MPQQRIVYLLLIILFTGGCENIESPFTTAEIPISKDIVDTTFWKKSNKYIIEKPDFTITSELTIQDGTVVIIKAGCSINVKDSGYISAQGSLTNPVVFTSEYDKKYGNNPNNSLVAPGNWNNIRIESKIKSVFNLCEFYYGGGGESPSTIELSDSSAATIANCIFKFNKGGNHKQLCGVLNASKGNSNTIIKSNSFTNNDLPLSINSIIDIDNSNIFYDNKTGRSNKHNTIQLNASTIVDRHVKWMASNVPICVYGQRLTLSKSAYVYFGNNTILKFDKNAGMRIECDTLNIFNSDGPGVAFTSYIDDSSLGDSNGDGINTSPQIGDWDGITDSIGRYYYWPNIKYSSSSLALSGTRKR